MTDGHTKKGRWVVKLELTEDMVKQLTRLIDMAKMMDADYIESKVLKEPFDILAHRAFLQEILNLLNKAMAEQQPFKEPLADKNDL